MYQSTILIIVNFSLKEYYMPKFFVNIVSSYKHNYQIKGET